MGANFQKILCEVLGIPLGLNSAEFGRKKSLKRLKKANKASSEEAKKRRKKLKYKKVVQTQRLQETEGQTYSAGGF